MRFHLHLVSLLLFSSIAFAPPEGVLKLTAEDHAAVQSFFKEIYDKIRIDGDPKEMPEIVLFRNDSDAAAQVDQTDKSKIYFSVDYLTRAGSVDAIAGTMAHELTHFEPQQIDRLNRRVEGHRILDEAEAQIVAITKRICRLGLVDAQGHPQRAPYSLEAIISELEQDRTFRNEYVNHENVAAGLKVFYAGDRYKRKYPKETTVPAFFGKLDASKRGWKLPRLNPKRWVDDARSITRETVRDLGEMFQKAPHKQFKILYERIANGNLSAAERKKSMEQMRALFQRGRSISLSQGRQLIKELPPRFFLKMRELRGGDSEISGTFFSFARLVDETLDALQKGRQPVGLSNFFLFENSIIPTLDQLYVQREIRSNPEIFRRHWGEKPPDVLLKMAAFVADQGPGLFGKKMVADAERIFKNLDADSLVDFLPRLPRSHARMLVSKISDADVLKLVRRLEPVLRAYVIETRPHLKTQVANLLSEKGRIGDIAELVRHTTGQNGRELAELDRSLAAALDIHIQESKKKEWFVPGDKVLSHLFRASTGDGYPVSWRESNVRERFEPYLNYLRKTGASSELLEGITRSLWDEHYGELHERSEVDFGGFSVLARELLTGESEEDWDRFQKRFPKASEKLIELISTAPLLYLGRVAWEPPSGIASFVRLPLNQVFSRLDPKTFLSVMALGDRIAVSEERGRPNPPGYERATAEKKHYFMESVSAEFMKRVENNEYTAHEINLGLRLLSHMPGMGSSPGLERVVALLNSRFAQSRDWHEALEYMSALPPSIFPTPRKYVEHIRALLHLRMTQLKNEPTEGYIRTSDLKDLVNELDKSLSHVDPALKQSILDDVAEQVRATPDEKPLLTVDKSKHEAKAIKGIEYANAMLEAYGKMAPKLRWDFLQWVRGKNAALGPEVHQIIRMGLSANGIFVNTEELETYVRSRFDAMGPLAKAAFFQVCLDGKDGLFHKWGYTKAIKNEILAGLNPELRKKVLELYDAAGKALPPVYQTVILSTAFAESAKGGSPEEALRHILQRMGALVHKFGQNLAFDSHLPESYRKELQKLWDEGQQPSWWHVQDLIRHQLGDIGAVGFKLEAIRNAGSTEITIELKGPDGKHHIASVQREAVAHGADVDAKDLREFVRILSRTRAGRQAYGFMSILVEDGNRTMAQELDRGHKPAMAGPMRENYVQSAQRLGGKYENGLLSLQNWMFESPRFETHALPDGKTFTTQTMAAGVPLKSIQETHPEIYREVSELLIRLEKEAQNDPNFPVDKDRMPGQVFIDLATRKITLLDHGQAKLVARGIIEAREPFIGATLTGNTQRIAELLAKFNIHLNASEQRQLGRDLNGVENPFRPLHALSWIFQNKKFADAETENAFWDLVHVVRAQARLAHWGESNGNHEVADEWRASAERELTPTQRTVIRIRDACIDAWNDLRARWRK